MNTNGVTDYSGRIGGTSRNHLFAVQFDVTDGYLGISQYDGDTLTDRVLLSPEQVEELVAFYKSRHPRHLL